MKKTLRNIAFLGIFGLSALGSTGCGGFKYGTDEYSCDTSEGRILAEKGEEWALEDYEYYYNEVRYSKNINREKAIEMIKVCEEEYKKKYSDKKQ